MGKFTNIMTDVFSIFGSPEWADEKLKTVPSNFSTEDLGNEFLRISIQLGDSPVNVSSMSGMLIVDIFSAFGVGPPRVTAIADILDAYLLRGVSFSYASGSTTQFLTSSFAIIGQDKDNPVLIQAQYVANFNHYVRS